MSGGNINDNQNCPLPQNVGIKNRTHDTWRKYKRKLPPPKKTWVLKIVPAQLGDMEISSGLQNITARSCSAASRASPAKP